MQTYGGKILENRINERNAVFLLTVVSMLLLIGMTVMPAVATGDAVALVSAWLGSEQDSWATVVYASLVGSGLPVSVYLSLVAAGPVSLGALTAILGLAL
jgi:hypothetical protein